MIFKTSADFNKEFKKLPKNLQDLTKKKLNLFFENFSHPSLRIKKVMGYYEEPSIMEMSVNMAIRITFQKFPDFLYLRHIGTHEVFRRP